MSSETRQSSSSVWNSSILRSESRPTSPISFRNTSRLPRPASAEPLPELRMRRAADARAASRLSRGLTFLSDGSCDPLLLLASSSGSSPLLELGLLAVGGFCSRWANAAAGLNGCCLAPDDDDELDDERWSGVIVDLAPLPGGVDCCCFCRKAATGLVIMVDVAGGLGLLLAAAACWANASAGLELTGDGAEVEALETTVDEDVGAV